ncbi:hypothetical protein SDC9_84148 [bioreactor metagenome]|uniref:Uncharacterized protein n=1 Tax=bioreactor metagenome TaxID=1076179 RepID=A0A644Z9G9_9ZZZZ
MLDETKLRGFVVVGRNVEQRVRAGILGVLGEIEGGGSVVAARAGHHLAAVVYVFHAEFHGGDMFPDAQGGCLPGGAADTDGVHSAGELLVDQLTEYIKINSPVFIKGGHNGRTGTGKYRLSH